MNHSLSEAAINQTENEKCIEWEEDDMHPDEEVHHEEDVECQVYLLCSVLQPWDACLHSITVIRNNNHIMHHGLPGGVYEVVHQGRDGQNEHKANLKMKTLLLY